MSPVEAFGIPRISFFIDMITNRVSKKQSKIILRKRLVADSLTLKTLKIKNEVNQTWEGPRFYNTFQLSKESTSWTKVGVSELPFFAIRMFTLQLQIPLPKSLPVYLGFELAYFKPLAKR